MRRRAYTGKHAAFDTERSKGPGVRKVGIVTKQTPRSEDDPIRIPITTPALVDSETWERVQALMHTNKLRAARRNSTPEATLLRGGFIVCGYCHHPLAVAHTHKHPDGTRTPVYRCHYGDKSMTRPHQMCSGGNLSINAPLIDAEVWARLEVLTKNPDLAAEAYARGMQRAQEDWKAAHNKAGAINTHVRKLTQQRDNLSDTLKNTDDAGVRAVLLGQLTEVVAQLAKATEDQQAVDEDVRQAEDQQQEMRKFRQEVVSQAERLEQFKQEVLALGEELAHNYYAEKRRTLETWGVQVKLFRKDDPDHDRWEMSILNNGDGGDRVSYHVKM
jgi:hypothetical protein